MTHTEHTHAGEYAGHGGRPPFTDAMAPSAPFPSGLRDRLVELICAGHSAGTAALETGIPYEDVLRAAAQDLRLAAAIAGRDPDGRQEERIRQRATLLVCMAMGMNRVDAARAAGLSDHLVSTWSATDSVFRGAYREVGRMAAEYGVQMSTRVTAKRAELVIGHVRTGATTAEACAAAGVAQEAVRARLERDGEFARRMREAEESGRQLARGA
ncbi:hypothetical protein ABT160_12210 [Streptomyces sp. NPDC001941]|uniref:hypothetical protein n=1 Tax=Streptomyces sp. NPDC001941 TaxID=3154659 RepID=UPI00331B6E8A